eukprot:572005-Pelagomonas_calceolata.AAC.2
MAQEAEMLYSTFHGSSAISHRSALLSKASAHPKKSVSWHQRRHSTQNSLRVVDGDGVQNPFPPSRAAGSKQRNEVGKLSSRKTKHF